MSRIARTSGEVSRWGDVCVQALRDATGKHPGLEIEIATGEDSLEGGRQAARVLLARSPRPTALVCVNDVMAVGALREVRARGLRTPEDVSVTGFDNVMLAQFSVPTLTTVHIPRDQIGRVICDCLMRSDAPSEQESWSSPSSSSAIRPVPRPADSQGPCRG